MPKYKITASKSHKKYSFVLTAENERLAKERIHEKGYSILSVEEFDETKLNKNIFLFKAKDNKWEIKSWKVAWNDIFKIYLKLRDWIWYEVLELYPKSDEQKDENYKKNILKELEEQYDFFIKNKKTKKQEEKKQENKEIKTDWFYLQKELEETYKLIDYVLEKTKNLFEKEELDIDEEKKEKLRKLYNSLIKLKSSTNIIKLKEVWEKVLEKVWEIELENIEKKKNLKAKSYLKETNKLLKEIWSNKKFVSKDDDILLKIKDFFNTISETLKEEKVSKKSKKTKKLQVSYSTLKTKILLNKYKDKYKENLIEIIKNFYVFILPFKKFSQKKEKLLLKKQVIKQNIYLLKNKLEKPYFSYTKALKWFDYILESIFNFFIFIRDYLFFVVLFYSLVFLLFLNINYLWIFNLSQTINYRWIFYFIIFIFVYFAIYFSRWLKTLFLNFILLFFVIYFWVINF